jgi:hypothetical protein
MADERAGTNDCAVGHDAGHIDDDHGDGHIDADGPIHVSRVQRKLVDP